MSRSYWQKTLTRRISRRRALAAGGAGGIGTLLLAACGGDSSPASKTDGSGLLAPVVDTSSKAKVGGTAQRPLTADIQTLDPNNTTSGSAHAPYGYSRLLLYRPALAPDLPKGETDPDSAESSEITPDGLRVTFKLRPDLKLDPRPPTNGRLMNAEDVKWSWERFSATNSSRGELLNSLSPTAPVQSMEVVDSRTVAFKLVRPVANTLSLFAFQRYMWLLPIEADGAFDPRVEMRGNGPWRLVKWEPSVGFTYERNEAWHIKGLPYLGGLYVPIVPEYAQRRAQLILGNLTTSDIRAEDVVATKREQPKLAMYPEPFPITRRPLIGFSFKEGSPFHDVRIRRAISMLIDRDPWIDTFYNVSAFEREGLPMDARWDSHYMAGDAPYWIDPKGNGLGEGAAYFKHNPAEATKLVRAAGFNQPIRVPGFFQGTTMNRQVEVLVSMISEGNLFEITSLENPPLQEWNTRFHAGQGLHDGIAFNQSTGQSGDIDQHISVRYNVGNGVRIMFPTVFPWYQKIQDLIVAQRSELDPKRRHTILDDLQKEMALQMPTVPWPGAANGFSLAWPYLANFATFNALSAQTPMTETWTRHWYDESQKV